MLIFLKLGLDVWFFNCNFERESLLQENGTLSCSYIVEHHGTVRLNLGQLDIQGTLHQTRGPTLESCRNVLLVSFNRRGGILLHVFITLFEFSLTFNHRCWWQFPSLFWALVHKLLLIKVPLHRKENGPIEVIPLHYLQISFLVLYLLLLVIFLILWRSLLLFELFEFILIKNCLQEIDFPLIDWRGSSWILRTQVFSILGTILRLPQILFLDIKTICTTW